jgi:hypothetical protein
MWLTNAKWYELLHHDQEQQPLRAAKWDYFYVSFSCLFSIDHHLLITSLKLWNGFNFLEIKSTAHEMVSDPQLKSTFMMSWILITNLPGFYANMSFIKSLLDVSSYQFTSHILHPSGSIVKLSPWIPLFIDVHYLSGVVNTDCCIWFPS